LEVSKLYSHFKKEINFEIMSLIKNSLKNFKMISFHGLLSLISSIIALGSILFLSFHYKPIHFSTYGIFLSVATIVLIFSKSDLDYAIISAKTDEEINMYLNMIIINCSIISIIIILLTFIFNIFNFTFYESSGWSNLLTFFLIIYIFVVSFRLSMNSYFIKNKKFVLYFFATSIKQIIFFLLDYFNSLGLVFFLIFSDLIIFFIFYNFFFKKLNFKIKIPNNFINQMVLLKPFYLFGSLTNLNLSIKEFVIIFFIQFQFGSVILGQFMFFKKTFTDSISLIKKVL
jgi:O-antigen/teichoic acid export membrane protein